MLIKLYPLNIAKSIFLYKKSYRGLAMNNLRPKTKKMYPKSAFNEIGIRNENFGMSTLRQSTEEDFDTVGELGLTKKHSSIMKDMKRFSSNLGVNEKNLQEVAEQNSEFGSIVSGNGNFIFIQDQEWEIQDLKWIAGRLILTMRGQEDLRI